MVEESVVLVDEADKVVGTMLKSLVHTEKTPLHRGLSVYVFDDKGRVIVQQRAVNKKTWPGVWSNSCCGHPLPGETYEAAAAREVKEELGVEPIDMVKVANYRYQFERGGVIENEICPIFRCKARGKVVLDPKEVKDWKWMNWNEWMEILKEDRPGADGIWSEWCKEEVLLLDPGVAFK